VVFAKKKNIYEDKLKSIAQ